MRAMRRPRLVYLVTHPISARLLLAGQLGYLRAAGFEVTVIASPGPDLDVVAAREGVDVVPVAMARAMRPADDARALAAVTAALRRLRPDVVNASTPKAGLLGMIAARALRVPVRVYLLRGLRLETERGWRRAVLAGTERIAAACAHEVIAVSASLRDGFVGAGLAPAGRVRVLGGGSSNGVDVDRFAPTAEVQGAAVAVRARLAIAAGAPVIGFVGRLARDKGIVELLDAFDRLRVRVPDARLVLVSADLADEDTPPEVAARVPRTPGVLAVPRVDDVRPYLAAMDVLGFPSHREGFPNVVLEAAALGVPAVGYPVTGVRDAIVDGVTGRLVPRGDAAALAGSLADLLADPARRTAAGEAARRRAVADFARPTVWRRWADLYRDALAARGLPAPRPG
jgi:glycosyltransferase involved in cell wall biosynthesis